MSHTDRHERRATTHGLAPMLIARAGFVLALTLSIIGNVADARRSTLAMIIGGVWPLLLMIAFEIIVRTPWPPGRAWRWPPIGGVSIVAAVAAFMSYRHLMSLLARIGEDSYGAAAGPVAFDGLMLAAAWAMLAMSRTERAATGAAQQPPAPARRPQSKSETRKPGPRPKTPAKTRPEATIGLAAVPATPEPVDIPDWAIRAAETMWNRHSKLNGHLWQRTVRETGQACSNPTRERLWPHIKTIMEEKTRQSA